MSWKLRISLLLALITVGTFWPVRTHEFVNYDDPDYVTANSIVQQGLTPQTLAWAFQNIHGEKTYWHPVTWISHLVDIELFGLKPAGHHLVNLLFHTLNVLLLFWILSAATGAVWPSALVAVLFAVHPLQVDTVAWVTERKNVLSTFFMLLSLTAYIQHAARPARGSYLLMIFLFCMALMAKPAVVTFPCLLLLLDFWPLRRISFARLSPSRGSEQTLPHTAPAISLAEAFREKLPLFFAAAASCVITMRAHQGLGLLEETARLPFQLRLENALVSYARYIKKMFWPDDLAVLYPHPGRWPLWEVVLAGLFLLGITAIVLRRTKTQPYLFTGWFWFLGMLVPAIGIVQVGAQAMADRFVYVPLVGLFILVAWVLHDFAQASPLRKSFALVAGIGIALLCIMATRRQLRHWKDSVALWEHTLRLTKNNYMAHQDLGVALRERGKLDEAAKHIAAAIAIRDNPFSRFEMSRVLQLQGDTNEAIAQIREAIRLAPVWPLAHERLAFLLAENQQSDEALKQYSELLRIAPNRNDVRLHAAVLAADNSRFSEAIQRYREVLKVEPDNPVALNNLAWLFSTNPDSQWRNGAEAVQLANRLCTLTKWKNPGPLATLAAAYAEAGSFQQAAGVAAQAVMVATAAGQTNVAAECERLRATVASGTPFRVPSPR